MPSKSKTKGSGFEREIAKEFTEMYGETFIRTPHSGAFIGGINQSRIATLTENQAMSFKGDIVPPDGWRKFNIECKFYSEFPWHQLCQNKPIPLLEQWIKQLTDVEIAGDCSLLLIKVNRLGKFVAWSHDLLVLPNSGYAKYIDVTGRVWYITSYEDFFKINKENVKNISIS